jgi:thioredoxin 1
MKEITSAEFDASTKGNAVIEFFSAGCMNCKATEPMLDAIAPEHTSITFAKINIEGHEELTQKFEVMSLPTILFFKGGEVVDKLVGLKPRTLLARKVAETYE